MVEAKYLPENLAPIEVKPGDGADTLQTHDDHCWQSRGLAMANTDIDTKPQNQNLTCSLWPGYRQNPVEAVETPRIAHYGWWP